jgi:alpha-beta hydrolase superfamily lysophospholipase
LNPRVDGAVSVGGVRLRVRSWIPPHPVGGVVIVHGLGDHGLRYTPVAEALAARGYAVAIPDLRGHGESGGRRGDVGRFSEFAADVAETVSSLRQSIPADLPLGLVGHSMGGLVVMRYLQGEGRFGGGIGAPSFSVPRGVVGAVLSAPWFRTRHPLPAWKRLMGRGLLHLLPGLTLKMDLSPDRLTRDPAERRAREGDPLLHDRCSARLYGEVERAQSEAWKAAHRLKLPLLIIVPDDDQVVDSAATLRFAERFGGETVLLPLPGGRHEPFHDLGRHETIHSAATWMDERLRAAVRGREEEGVVVPRTPRRARPRAEFTRTTERDDDG